MAKLRVIHVVPDLGVAGAEKLVTDIISNYDQLHFEMAVLSLFARKDTLYEKELAARQAKVYYLNKKEGLDLSIIKKINRVFKDFKPDVVHTHRYVMKYVILPTLYNKIPVRIHTVHNVADKELGKVNQQIQNFAYKYLNFKPVAISDRVKETIKQVYGLQDVSLIYNGIDVEKFAINDYNRDSPYLELIHVGRFLPQKNHDMLIEAFRMIASRHDKVKLKLVGDGELRSAIEDKVKKYGLDNRVEFLGIRKDIPAILAASDIFVMSSSWEGLPLTVLEAMSAGLPIVATAVGGIPDVVKDNGFLIENYRDVELFASKIEELILDKQLRLDMATLSRKLSRRYDIKNTTREYQDLYLKMITEKKVD